MVPFMGCVSGRSALRRSAGAGRGTFNQFFFCQSKLCLNQSSDLSWGLSWFLCVFELTRCHSRGPRQQNLMGVCKKHYFLLHWSWKAKNLTWAVSDPTCAGAAGGMTHAWDVILKFYEMKMGHEYNSTPARKLSQSFGLDLSGSASSNKQVQQACFLAIISASRGRKNAEFLSFWLEFWVFFLSFEFFLEFFSWVFLFMLSFTNT